MRQRTHLKISQDCYRRHRAGIYLPFKSMHKLIMADTHTLFMFGVLVVHILQKICGTYVRCNIHLTVEALVLVIATAEPQSSSAVAIFIYNC